MRVFLDFDKLVMCLGNAIVYACNYDGTTLTSAGQAVRDNDVTLNTQCKSTTIAARYDYSG